MTEQEWSRATDPKPMLNFVWGKTSDRKLKLFAVACCRRASHLISPDRRVKEALGVVERFTDGSASEEEVTAFQFGMMSLEVGSWSQGFIAEVPRGWRFIGSILQGTVSAITLLADGVADEVRESANDRQAVLRAPSGGEIRAARAAWAAAESARLRELAAQSSLLRDLIGPLLFRSITINPAWPTWHDGLIVSMARQMYESRDFTDMPVLADALEEAGCTNEDILGHCRSGGDHVRGCWVIDLVLGKS